MHSEPKVKLGKEVTSLPKTKEEANKFFVSELGKLIETFYKIHHRENILKGKQFKKEVLCQKDK